MKRVRQDGRNAQNPCLERPEDVLDGSSSSTPLWPWQNTILEVRLSRVREHLRGDEPPRPSGGWEREETLYVICPFLFQIDRISSMSTKYLCEHAPRQTSGEARTFPNPPAAPKNRAFEGGSGKTVTEENPSTFLVFFGPSMRSVFLSFTKYWHKCVEEDHGKYTEFRPVPSAPRDRGSESGVGDC